jgi:plasmid stability protein
MEQIVIRNLPVGTKAGLRLRADANQRSVEAEAREILTEAVNQDELTLVDLLTTDEGVSIDFEPQHLGLTGRIPEL